MDALVRIGILIAVVCGFQGLWVQAQGISWYRPSVWLSDSVSETSGLFATEEGLWTFNDSGGAPEFFLLDTARGYIRRVVKVRPANNVDWEAVTTGGGSVWVGDIGNNAGKRGDLRVYRVAVPGPEDSVLVPVSDIRFRWPDVLYGLPGEKSHDRDAEGMVWMGDSLFVLSKSWKSGVTRMGRVGPGSPQILELTDSVVMDFVVTDVAWYSGDGVTGILGLVGYEPKIPGDVWLWLFRGKGGSGILQEEVERHRLGNALQLGQVEGLVFLNEREVVLSAERFGLMKGGRLHFLRLP